MRLSLQNQYTGVIAVSKYVYHDLADVIFFLKDRDFSLFIFESDEEFEDDGEEELSQTDERTPKKRKGILKYIIMAVVLLVAVKWGIEYFSQDKMPETSEAELKDKIDLDTSSKYDFISFGNNVVMCNKYGVFAYNSGGKVVWQYETNLTSPVLSVCGDNLLVTDSAQSSARVFDLSGKLKNDVTL